MSSRKFEPVIMLAGTDSGSVAFRVLFLLLHLPAGQAIALVWALIHALLERMVRASSTPEGNGQAGGGASSPVLLGQLD